tara:strand:+ start:163 stop:390 length:228 start_codon:yes stop_codon:yes gene_type:complete
MQYEALPTKRLIDFREQRLILAEWNKLDHCLNDHGMRWRFHGIFDDHQLGALHIELENIGARGFCDLIGAVALDE